MRDQEVFTINDIFEKNLIEDFIQSYCYELNIDDMRKETLQTWRACCAELGEKVFKPVKNQMRNSAKFNKAGKYNSNNNAYDFFLLDILADAYIKLSDKYNKIQSIEIYALFCNIAFQTVYQWKDIHTTFINCINENGIYKPINLDTNIDINNYAVSNNIYINIQWYNMDKLTITPIEIYKKIINTRGAVINDKLADNNNPVALFGAQNADKERYFEIEAQKVGAISLDQLPALPGIVQNAQTTDGGS